MGAKAAAAGLPALLAAALLLGAAFFPSASAASSYPASELVYAASPPSFASLRRWLTSCLRLLID
jgi:hypothetical protein